LAIEQIGADLVKPLLEEFVDLHLALAEFGPNSVQKDMDFAFGQSHNAGRYLDGALVAHETKRPGQHVRAVGIQNDRAALDVDGLYRAIGAARPAR